MKLLKISGFLILLSLSLTFAQSFTGNYLLQDGDVKLGLEQQNNTQVLGVLSGNGLSFQLEGELNPDSSDTAYGYVYTDDETYLFAIVLEEPVLNMILFGILENGEPNPDDTQTFIFNRVDNMRPNNQNQPQANTPTAPTTTTRLPSTNTAPTTPTPATTAPTTTAPTRLPTINTPSSTPAAPATSVAQNGTAQSNGANPLASAPIGATGSPSQNPLVAADPFNGTFEGDGLKLVLNKNGNVYGGSLNFQGNSYPVTAAKQANGIVGNFKAGGKLFSFSAAMENGKLTLVSDGAIYVLSKK